jgi:hypothetical protein
VVTEAFVPDLMASDRPFRPGLRVKGVKAHANVFEMTWDNDGRATFSYGAERARAAARDLAAHRNPRQLHSTAWPELTKPGKRLLAGVRTMLLRPKTTRIMQAK